MQTAIFTNQKNQYGDNFAKLLDQFGEKSVELMANMALTLFYNEHDNENVSAILMKVVHKLLTENNEYSKNVFEKYEKYQQENIPEDSRLFSYISSESDDDSQTSENHINSLEKSIQEIIKDDESEDSESDTDDIKYKKSGKKYCEYIWEDTRYKSWPPLRCTGLQEENYRFCKEHTKFCREANEKKQHNAKYYGGHHKNTYNKYGFFKKSGGW